MFKITTKATFKISDCQSSAEEDSILSWNVNMKALCSFIVSVPIYQTTDCHTTEEMNLLKSFTASEEHHTLLTSTLFGQYLLQLDVTSQKTLFKQMLD